MCSGLEFDAGRRLTVSVYCMIVGLLVVAAGWLAVLALKLLLAVLMPLMVVCVLCTAVGWLIALLAGLAFLL